MITKAKVIALAVVVVACLFTWVAMPTVALMYHENLGIDLMDFEDSSEYIFTIGGILAFFIIAGD